MIVLEWINVCALELSEAILHCFLLTIKGVRRKMPFIICFS